MAAFPTQIENAYAIAHSWLDVIESFSCYGPLHTQTFAVYESFDTSLFNAITGWYRTAGLTLRAGVDDLLTGLYYQINGDHATFEKITRGAEQSSKFPEMRKEVRKNTGDKVLFDYPGEYGNLYDILSIYTHRIAHNELWGSNGPVLTDEGFNRWFDEYSRADKILKAAVDAGRKFT